VSNILVANNETSPRPRRGETLKERPMKTLTTMVEWSAVAIAVYAALSFATSAQALATFA
jgi:hypothetical protein